MNEEEFEPLAQRVPLPSPRALTEKERELIDVLLEGPLGREELREQAKTVRVIATCSCGCRSVFLEADRRTPSARFTPEETPFGTTGHVPITAVQRKARGSTEVTLHIVQGYMEELEIWTGGFGVRARVDPAKLEYEDWGRADKEEGQPG